MKLVTVEDLREGDIIANDVLLDDYTVVLSKGTVIKTPYIEKLRELQVFTVYIEEKSEEPIEPIVKKCETDTEGKQAACQKAAGCAEESTDRKKGRKKIYTKNFAGENYNSA